MQETQEMRVQFLGWEDALKKEMASHSNILAWRIPWTEEPGRLQSMGWQRVGHEWATKPPPLSSTGKRPGMLLKIPQSTRSKPIHPLPTKNHLTQNSISAEAERHWSEQIPREHQWLLPTGPPARWWGGDKGALLTFWAHLVSRQGSLQVILTQACRLNWGLTFRQVKGTKPQNAKSFLTSDLKNLRLEPMSTVLSAGWFSFKIPCLSLWLVILEINRHAVILTSLFMLISNF